MDWEKFIKDIASQHGLSIDETKTLLIRFPKDDESLDERQLSAKLDIGIDAVKKRMQKIYTKFQPSCPELANKDGAGKSRDLHNYLRREHPNCAKIKVSLLFAKLSRE